MSTGIGYNASFEVINAFVEAGATTDELLKMEEGKYPPWFVARIIAWYRGSILVSANKEDAIARKQQRESKRRGRGR